MDSSKVYAAVRQMADLPDSNSGDCGFDSHPPYQPEGEMNKVPEWHVIYQEWAIHTPTGRIRHLPCKRDVRAFSYFKKVAEFVKVDKKTGEVRHFKDASLHKRREMLMAHNEPITHKCQGTDPYEEIEEITVPTMVVETAICYMKV